MGIWSRVCDVYGGVCVCWAMNQFIKKVIMREVHTHITCISNGWVNHCFVMSRMSINQTTNGIRNQGIYYLINLLIR